MGLSELIPDETERAVFVSKFVMASGKAMQELRDEARHLNIDQTAEELEARIRAEIGPGFPLPRPELLQLAKDVIGDAA